MSSKKLIPLQEAQNRFSTLLSSLNEPDKTHFITFVFEKLTCGNNGYFEKESQTDENCDNDLLDDPVATLNNIANEIKKLVPLDAILPSEHIKVPLKGENSDCISDLTIHVDEFLYNDEDVENLVDDGKLNRNYCKDCGSKNIEPMIFISHSTSREELYYIFNTRLPILENKTVLDIGSRIGSVLYGAYVFTDAVRIIGVEMNKDLCKLQSDIVQKYKMNDRIEILHKKIEEDSDIVKCADVILINNAFEFYVSEEKQIEIWQFLKCHIKSNTILVTRPHLETTFKNIDTGILLHDWVEPYHLEENCMFGDSDIDENNYCDIAFYKVL